MDRGYIPIIPEIVEGYLEDNWPNVEPFSAPVAITGNGFCLDRVWAKWDDEHGNSYMLNHLPATEEMAKSIAVYMFTAVSYPTGGYELMNCDEIVLSYIGFKEDK